MPSFTRVLHSVADAYATERDAIASTSAQLREIYDAAKRRAQSRRRALTAHALDLAYRGLAQQYDIRHGGFGGAPKFPPTMSLDFLLRYWKRTGTGYALEMVAERFAKWRAAEYTIRSAAAFTATPWMRLARPAFREDALRQRAARPARRQSLAGDAGRRGAGASPRRQSSGSRAR